MNTEDRKLKIKDKWCEFVLNIIYGYDGYNDINSLKKLLDEIGFYINNAINCNDSIGIYMNRDGIKCNILMEELDG